MSSDDSAGDGLPPDMTSNTMHRHFTSHPELLAPSLVGSDETANNLPGPGRNLGRLYDALGGRLSAMSAFLRENMGKQRSRRMVHEEAALALRVASVLADEDAMLPGSSDSPSSRGTDSTESNLPGPGRTVGKSLS